jgi:LuxR family maltose regulon positive regulatory protein
VRAERYALQALQKARQGGQFEVESKTLFLLLRLYLHNGKYSCMRDILNQLEQLTSCHGFINRHAFYEIETGWLNAMLGKGTEVASWIKSSTWSDNSNVLVDGFGDLAKCKFYLSSNDFNAMLVFLESRTSEFGVSKFLFGQIGLAVNSAVCHYHLGNRSEALRYLRIAYELANPNELIMPFVEMGNSMRSLAGAALKSTHSGIPAPWLEAIRTKATTYAKRLAYVRSCFLEKQGSDASPRLTGKELVLLEDLSQGLSRTEISHARNISVNTVKVMLQTVYDKLGARNGIEAVRIAATKNLL